MRNFQSSLHTYLPLALLVTTSSAFAMDIQFSSAPSNDLALTVQALQSAQKSILLNIYEMTSPEIADVLIQKVQAGVHVEVLEEGQPVGGMSAAGKGIQDQIVQAMQARAASDRFVEMSSKYGRRRFHYDHGKYVVIDGSALLIGSENYSPTGQPESGTIGNRGWEVFITDPALATGFSQMFKSDTDLNRNQDIQDLVASTHPLAGSWQSPGVYPNTGTPPEHFTATSAKRITSPDTSLSGLKAMIDSATKTLDIEQMTFDSTWKSEREASPLFQSVLAAARRGVHVRVLLNDDAVFSHPGHPKPSKNLETLNQMNKVASQEGLSLEARTANLKAMGVDYIHNKGALVDDDQILISSINWDENSVTNNRETAVLVSSADAYSYYKKLFDQDWQVSGAKVETLAATNLNCPKLIHANILIGMLDASSGDEASFAPLSNHRLLSDLELSNTSAKECTFTDTKSEGTLKQRFIQLRERADGTITFAFEGYTPDGKVYSIRGVIEDNTDFDGSFESSVFDGSGPTKKCLGPAEVKLGVPASTP
jgi:phosphatidylserine/phosphatidylglycerophosphate/cardiolipin synthase-like enzyme